MAEDGDAPGVAAEVGDVLVDPRQGGQLVHEPLVADDARPTGIRARVEET